MNQLTNLNWVSVLAAFAAYFVLGALWFTLLFAKQYKISLGKANEELNNKAPIFILGPALCSLVITVANAVLFSALNISTFNESLEFSFIVGFGFLVANTMNIAINPNIPRPIHYGIISGAYHLAGIFMVNTILVAMK